MIIDSHCHLDYSNLYDQLDDVIKRAELNKVKYLLTICTTLESFERIKLIIHKYENIYGTFGIHPHETKKFTTIDSRFILDLKKNIKKLLVLVKQVLIFIIITAKKKYKKKVLLNILELLQN